MKKRLYTLVISFSVLLVLGLGIWLLYLQPSEDGDANSNKSTIPIGITGYTNDTDAVTIDVKTMTIINQYGQITLTPVPRDSNATTDSAKWMIAELDNAESGDWSANDMALAFYIISAVGEIEVEPSELGKYGLDNPSSIVRLEYHNGNTFEYRFGDKLSISGAKGGYYVMRDDDPKVYVVEDYYYEKAQVQLKDVVNYHILDALEDNKKVSKVMIYGPGYKEPLEIEPIPEGEKSPLITATHRFTKPILREMPTDSSVSLFKSIFGETGLNAVAVAAAYKGKLPDDVLAEYGLDNPQKMVTFNNSGEVHTLKAGKKDGNYVYLQLDDVPMVYVVLESSISTWYNAEFDSLTFRIMYVASISKVKKITFETAGKTYTFDVLIDEDDEVASVKLNGVKATVKSYRSLYTEFIGIAYKERDSKTYTSAPDMTITVIQTDGTKDVIQLVPATARRKMYLLNGKGGFLVSYDHVDKIQELLKACEKSTID